LSLKAIYLLLSVLILGQCASHLPKDDNYTFEWDMSVENHTGKVKNLYAIDGKHRGMSAFGWHTDFYESINQLVKNNIEAAAIIPFLYQQTELTKVLRHKRLDIGQWSRNDSIFMTSVNEMHGRGMHVFLKPHIWMRDGWRSNIQMDNEDEWDTWFESYRKHMVHYAMLAELLEIDLYCIGTELKSSIKAQPHKWNELITEIKTVYSGKLTYAMNWDDDFDDIKFWEQMDYIGIQAYYPLTKQRNPLLSDIMKGWERHIKKLEKASIKYKKPILFTEIGYRSDEIATIEPWVWDSAVTDTTNIKSNKIQNLAYEALFQKVWNEDWFAGMYFWQWHIDSNEERSRINKDFSPRYKSAENTLAKWYGKENF
jgi:hypothetical protein